VEMFVAHTDQSTTHPSDIQKPIRRRTNK
jgi:hypothetical protein